MMGLRKCIMFFALLALPAVCLAHLGGRTKAQETDAQYYCGRNLARVLATVCYDEVDKRSDVSSNHMIGTRTMYDPILAPYYKEQDTYWPWMPHYKARELNGLSDKRQKRFIGVVSECCEKACSLNELLSYC